MFFLVKNFRFLSIFLGFALVVVKYFINLSPDKDKETLNRTINSLMEDYLNLKTVMLACLLGAASPLSADIIESAPPIEHQVQKPSEDAQKIGGGNVFFVPHFYVKAQAGGAYDVGEAKFSELVSPALSVSFGYQATELFGLRANFNGMWARNRYAYPQEQYKWNFLQGAIDAQLNLTALFLGSKPDRRTYAYVFAGAGVNYSFNNDDAVKASQHYGVDFRKLWEKNRWNPVIRFGLGLDYSVTENIAIGTEVGANMLPDHFNSKIGKNDNKDWHFNAMVGVKFTIGDSYGRTENIYAEPEPEPAPPTNQFVDVPVEKISFNVNVYFIINRSDIRANQLEKLHRLLNYLNEHPKAFIRLSGYADRDTGTPAINMRLSRERAAAVSKWLTDAGIQEWRIRRFAKGDKVQPFDIPSDNRCCICYVYDPDHPERIDNWY